MNMLPRYLTMWVLFALVCGLFSNAHGASSYDESISGDFSNSGLAPTPVRVGLGSNVIAGSTGNHPAIGIDLDFFSITVPSGAALNLLTVLPGTTTGGGSSFIGMQAGPHVTVAAPFPSSGSGLLGWVHYSTSDINRDILSRMGIPVFGSAGFTAPLGPGTYSFWIQEFNPGTVNYDFDLTLAAAVPEPKTYAVLAIGFILLIAALRDRRPLTLFLTDTTLTSLATAGLDTSSESSVMAIRSDGHGARLLSRTCSTQAALINLDVTRPDVS